MENDTGTVQKLSWKDPVLFISYIVSWRCWMNAITILLYCSGSLSLLVHQTDECVGKKQTSSTLPRHPFSSVQLSVICYLVFCFLCHVQLNWKVYYFNIQYLYRFILINKKNRNTNQYISFYVMLCYVMMHSHYFFDHSIDIDVQLLQWLVLVPLFFFLISFVS